MWDHDEQSTMRAGMSVNVVGSQVTKDDVDEENCHLIRWKINTHNP